MHILSPIILSYYRLGFFVITSPSCIHFSNRRFFILRNGYPPRQYAPALLYYLHPCKHARVWRCWVIWSPLLTLGFSVSYQKWGLACPEPAEGSYLVSNTTTRQFCILLNGYPRARVWRCWVIWSPLLILCSSVLYQKWGTNYLISTCATKRFCTMHNGCPHARVWRCCLTWSPLLTLSSSASYQKWGLACPEPAEGNYLVSTCTTVDSAYCPMDTRIREYDGVVLIDRLFLYLALRRHTRSEV